MHAKISPIIKGANKLQTKHTKYKDGQTITTGLGKEQRKPYL